MTNEEVGGPADGNKHEEAGNDEHDSSSNGHFAFLSFTFHTVGALSPNDAESDPRETNDDGDGDECSGSLQVWRCIRERSIDFALLLACTLHHTVHPQTLPDKRGSYDATVEDSAFPVRESTDEDATEKTDDGQDQAQNLSHCRHHADALLIS